LTSPLDQAQINSLGERHRRISTTFETPPTGLFQHPVNLSTRMSPLKDALRDVFQQRQDFMEWLKLD
jgi:hypothetical protein